MSYNEELVLRIRNILYENETDFTEKKMFGGLAFMINEKMCFGVTKDEIMLRVMDNVYESLLEENGVRPMNFTGRIMKGFLFIEEVAFQQEKDLRKWIDYGLEFAEKGIVKSKKKS